LRFVPLLAAVLAVLAGLCSLHSSRLGEAMLSLKNEAVLAQGRASDSWAEYEAQSIKANLYEIAAENGSARGSASRLAEASRRYRKQQAPVLAAAHTAQEQRDAELASSQRVEDRKVSFDIAVALYEVAIVLASIAAMVRKHWLLTVSAIGGALGLIFTIVGLT